MPPATARRFLRNRRQKSASDTRLRSQPRRQLRPAVPPTGTALP